PLTNILDTSSSRFFSPFDTSHFTFSPDTHLVAGVWEAGRAVRVWTTSDGAPVADPITHTNSVISLAFSDDGTKLITGTSNGIAQVWEPATGKPLTPPLPHEASVRSPQFSPDAKLLLTTAGNAAWIWELPSGKLRGRRRHAQPVTYAAFSPNAERL